MAHGKNHSDVNHSYHNVSHCGLRITLSASLCLLLCCQLPPWRIYHDIFCVLLQGERVLDMAAAPGGKTTYLAQLMQNKGVLVANELKKERIPSLVANLARMGVSICVTSNMDGRKVCSAASWCALQPPSLAGRACCMGCVFTLVPSLCVQIPEVMHAFDRVLLDAPCTGLGIISRDPSVRTQKTKEDIVKMAFLQKQLAIAAVDSIDAESKTGGILVYSTCSVTVEENEAVVNYLLRKRHLKLLPIFPEGAEDVGRPVRALAACTNTSHALFCCLLECMWVGVYSSRFLKLGCAFPPSLELLTNGRWNVGVLALCWHTASLQLCARGQPHPVRVYMTA